MSQYTLSQEEINKALLLSPYSLSDSPHDWGLKAKEIKKYFYQPISYLTERLNLKLQVVGEVLSGIEEKALAIEKEAQNSLSSHDSSQLSHSALFTEIRELISELNQSLSSHRIEENAHASEIAKSISLHNQDTSSHNDIRKSIEELLALSQNAYALAQGKSRIIPLSDVYELLDHLENNDQSSGDVFILEEKLIPDLIFYKKLTDLEVEEEIQNGAVLLDYDSYSLGQVTFEPGQVVIAYNKKLVGTESGVDLSRLATKERVVALETRTQELATEIENGIAELMLLLDTKEDKRIVSTPSEVFALENLHEYRFSTISSLEFTLPQAQGDLEALISFHSGSEPTIFTQPSGLIMSGDDCLEGAFIPVSNRIYEISIKKLMGVCLGKVSCVDYEVI
ncbi:MAG: hypothetical protein IJ400_02555 [Clostridia bacterium]|nr:hypothetical protein [Clostridia bacterium]